MKKLLFKCLMIVAIFGMVLSFQGVQSAKAFAGCDIDDLTAIDSNTVKVEYDSEECPYGSYLMFQVRKQGSNAVIGHRIINSPDENNRILYLNLFAGKTFQGGTYVVDMYFSTTGQAYTWVDTDSFYVCCPI